MFDPLRLCRGRSPAAVAIWLSMSEVVVLPFVPVTAIAPAPACDASARTTPGSTRSAATPAIAVPPPRPETRDAAAAA